MRRSTRKKPTTTAAISPASITRAPWGHSGTTAYTRQDATAAYSATRKARTARSGSAARPTAGPRRLCHNAHADTAPASTITGTFGPSSALSSPSSSSCSSVSRCISA
uniref:hypothetical protein n=1 Tax=Nonomuraea gerenzanensis TaxID=93944 RepID=UPI00287F9A54|nr:hypothetical protein [Nonomuraea gerenzanensis]